METRPEEEPPEAAAQQPAGPAVDAVQPYQELQPQQQQAQHVQQPAQADQPQQQQGQPLQQPEQQQQQQQPLPLPTPSALGAYTQREEHLQRQEALGEIEFAYVVNDGTPINMKRCDEAVNITQRVRQDERAGRGR